MDENKIEHDENVIEQTPVEGQPQEAIAESKINLDVGLPVGKKSRKLVFSLLFILGLILLLVSGYLVYSLFYPCKSDSCSDLSNLTKSVLSDTTTATGITIESPYKNYGYNYKGNLHAHSNYTSGTNKADDGTESAKTSAQWYADNKFDFYALTGHYVPYNTGGNFENPTYQQMTITTNPLPDNKDIIWMGVSLENSFNPQRMVNSELHVGMINLGAMNTDGTYKFLNGSGENLTGKVSQLSTLKLNAAGSIVYGTNNSAKNAQNIVKDVNDNNGIVIINHPYAYTRPMPVNPLKPNRYDGWRCRMLGDNGEIALVAATSLSGITGIEINEVNSGNGTNILDKPTDGFKCGTFGNNGNQTTANDVYGTFKKGTNNNVASRYSAVSVWDEMLLKGKKVWAFSNDDSHGCKVRGNSFNIVNSQLAKGSLSRSDILTNIKNGNFYASTPITTGYYSNSKCTAPSKEYYDLKVEVSPNKKEIHVSTTKGDSMRVVVGYKSGAMAESTKKSGTKYIIYTPNGYEKYVRFEILNSNGKEVAWSQPIFINNSACTLPSSEKKLGYYYSSEKGAVSVDNGAEVDDITKTRLKERIGVSILWKTLKFSRRSTVNKDIRIMVHAYGKNGIWLGHSGWHSLSSTYYYIVPQGTDKIQYVFDKPVPTSDALSWLKIESIGQVSPSCNL